MARLVQLLAVLALTHVALEATAQSTGLIPTGEPLLPALCHASSRSSSSNGLPACTAVHNSGS